MTEERFWEIVESFHWEDDERDHDRRRVELLHTLCYDELVELQQKFREKKTELGDIEKRFGREVHGVSDDGWDDVRAHVIGCGREEYELTLNDIDRLQKRIDDHDYRESFAYCIPFPHDVAELSIRTHEARAHRYIEELREVMFDKMYSDGVKAKIAALLGHLQKVSFWTPKEELQAAVDGIKALPDSTWSEPWNPTAWGVPNLASDLQRYILN